MAAQDKCQAPTLLSCFGRRNASMGREMHCGRRDTGIEGEMRCERWDVGMGVGMCCGRGIHCGRRDVLWEEGCIVGRWMQVWDGSAWWEEVCTMWGTL